MMRSLLTLTAALAFAGCGKLDHLGRPPTLNPNTGTYEHRAMSIAPLPETIEPARPTDRASLWSRERGSLLGDRRAGQQGDIMTVVIQIDERAEFSNSSSRSRSANQTMGVPQFFGIPQRLAEDLPPGATIDPAVSLNSNGGSNGTGTTSRQERLTLRVAATVVEVLPNGVLRIQGSQEVRVNFEIRELLITGFVRPEDVSRQNEVTYDKIAQARISYGGRGQITDVQQPRIGQQITDAILPF